MHFDHDDVPVAGKDFGRLHFLFDRVRHVMIPRWLERV